MTSLRWSDGVYGGLIAGAVLALFYMGVDAFILKQPIFGQFTFLASMVVGPTLAASGNGAVIALGLGLHFVFCVIGGLIYALFALRLSALVRAPSSIVFGLIFGLISWLVFVDLVMPLGHLADIATQPWPESVFGATIFYGFALCEFLTSRAASTTR